MNRRPQSRKSQPGLESLESRVVLYSATGNAWMNPQVITMSFMPDGTNLGGPTSNLVSTFNNNPNLNGRWQTQILKAAQLWAQQTNINLVVVPDDGAPSGDGADQEGDPNHGDIRIGGYNFGNSTLAWSYQPPPINNYSIAGDIMFNTGMPYNIGQTYDLFTVAAHEFGHALGLGESSVGGSMEYPTYQGVKAALASDDIAGIRSIYSANGLRSYDVFNGQNYSMSTATPLTNLLDPLQYSVMEPNLDIAKAGQSEYFSVTAPLTLLGSMNITVQSQGLSLLAPKVTVYTPGLLGLLGSPTTVASASGAGQYGTTVNVSVPNVIVGQTYYIQVQGADNTSMGTGDYSLGVSFSGLAPTQLSPVIAYLDGSTPSSGGGMAQYSGQGFGLSDGPPTIMGISPDTGSSSSDGITNANRIVISGIAPNGETVTVYNNGTTLGTTVADANGNWTFDNTGTALPDGNYVLTATATDPAGNISPLSLPYGMTIDTATPETPVIGGIAAGTATSGNGATTADNTPFFFGTAAPFSQVSLFEGVTLLGSTAADGNGHWNFTDTTDTLQSVKCYTFTALSTDLAGNNSATSAAYYVTTIAPPSSAPSVNVSTAGLTTTSLLNSNNLGAAAGYAVLSEGAGTNGLVVSSSIINGNVGVGGAVTASVNFLSTINGEVDLSTANNGQFSSSWSTITGGTSYNVSGVASALSSINSLSATLGSEPGTPIAINGSTTINASGGVLDASGHRVFTVTSFSTNSRNVLTINGDAAGDAVVLNFTQGVSFNNQVVLSGITADQVLYNFVGGSSGYGGPSVQINDNAWFSRSNQVQGDFFDPNGAISISNTRLTGRLLGGGNHKIQVGGGVTITTPLTPVVTSNATSVQVFHTIATPTFSGVASANAQVAVLEDGMVIGVANTDASGNWTFTCDTLTSGLHRMAFEGVNVLGTFSAVADPMTIQV